MPPRTTGSSSIAAAVAAAVVATAVGAEVVAAAVAAVVAAVVTAAAVVAGGGATPPHPAREIAKPLASRAKIHLLPHNAGPFLLIYTNPASASLKAQSLPPTGSDDTLIVNGGSR